MTIAKRVVQVCLLSALSLALPGLIQAEGPQRVLRTVAADGTVEERPVPANATVTAVAGGGGSAPTIYTQAANGRDEQVILELRDPPLARRGGARATRADRTALAAAHARVAAELQRLAPGRAGASSIHREFVLAFNGIAATIPVSARQALAGLPDVRAIHPDAEVRANLDSSVPFVGAPTFWADHGGYRGAGTVIAVIDTGIDYTHADLGACAAVGPGCKVIGGYDFVEDDADPRDLHGHGTHVAAIAAGNGTFLGVAPDASLLAFRVLNQFGFGLTSDVIAGIEAAMDPDGDLDTSDHADVANLSLGGPGDPDDPSAQAVDSATAAGVLVVAAAGNDADYFCIGSPGAARTALTVGAIDESPARAGFSSRGPAAVTFEVKPEITAPGVAICAAQAAGTHLAPSCLDASHVEANGTSMATPHVAGAAALLRGVFPSLAPADVKSLLVQNATPLGSSALDVGAGALNVPAAAAAHTVVAPAALSFGRDDGTQAVWTTHESVTVRNLDVVPRLYSLTVESAGYGLPTGATVDLAPATFSLAPGASTTVDVTLTVDNAQVADVLTEPFAHEGRIIIVSGSETQRLPIVFFKAPLLRVQLDRPGTVVVWAPMDVSTVRSGSGTTVDFFLPAGTYDVIAIFSEGYVVHESVAAGDYHEEPMAATEAIYTMLLTGRSEDGSAVPFADWSSRLHYRQQPAFELLSIAGFFPGGFTYGFSLRSNTLSENYGLELALFGELGDSRYMITKGVVGLDADRDLTNTSAELVRGDVRHHFLSGQAPSSGLDLFWVSFYAGGALGSFTPEYHEIDHTIWFTASPFPSTPYLVQPRAGGHNGALFRGATTPGLIEGLNFGPRTPVYRTTTGELPINLGPAWFFDRFYNDPDRVFAFAPGGGWLWTFHTQGGDGPDAPTASIPWRLSSNGVEVATGLAPQHSDNGPQHPVASVPTAAYVFETDPLVYSVGGMPATTRVVATFDLSRYPDVNPPYIPTFALRGADGRLTDVVTIGDAAVLDVEVRDPEDDADLTVGLSTIAGGIETPVAVTRLANNVFHATMACVAAGPIDLVLRTTDHSGNTLDNWMTPAFVCNPIVCDAGDADDDGICGEDDPCTNVAGGQTFVAQRDARLVVGNLANDATAHDDRLSLRGTFRLPVDQRFFDFDPLHTGARVILRDGLDDVKVDVTLSAEAYSRATQRGWSRNALGDSWIYRDRTATPLGGIDRVSLRVPREPIDVYGGTVTVSITGRHGSFPLADALPPNVTIVLGNQDAAQGGRCGESAFTSTDCRSKTSIGRVICRR